MRRKIFFLILILTVFVPFFIVNYALAETTEETQITEITLNVPLPGMTMPLQISSALGNYIKAWYSFIIGGIGIIATVMIMVAGFKWLTSGGNSSKTGDAKDMIVSAIIGLVLAFLSYTVLYLINPNLTIIHLPDLKSKSVSLSGSSRISNPGQSSGNRNITSPGITGGTDAPPVPCNGGDYSRGYTTSYEGYRSEPYWDVDGYSIGYGHHYQRGQTVPQSITHTQGMQLFESDYTAAYDIARSTFSENWDTMGTARQATLIDMAYNMGSGVFSEFSNMTQAVINENYEQAAEEILDSQYAQQLPQRSANNAELIRNNNTELYAQQAQNNCI